MSDELPSSTHPGTISPRNIDTQTYRVLRRLPVPGIAEVGETFSSWPQGTVFACVSRIGLGPVRNGDILTWLERGMIERVKPLTAAQERVLYEEQRGAATTIAAEAQIAPVATGSDL